MRETEREGEGGRERERGAEAEAETDRDRDRDRNEDRDRGRVREKAETEPAREGEGQPERERDIYYCCWPPHTRAKRARTSRPASFPVAPGRRARPLVPLSPPTAVELWLLAIPVASTNECSQAQRSYVHTYIVVCEQANASSSSSSTTTGHARTAAQRTGNRSPTY